MNKLESKVIIITGPCGAGKTTISKLIYKKYHFILISGDEIKNELFPDIKDIEKHPQKLKKVKHEIFVRAKENFDQDKNVVIDYVVLGKDYIQKHKKAFADNLQIKVLFPNIKVILNRDKSRKCWTAGKKCVDELYKKFMDLESLIGSENYIDNSNETPRQTLEKYFDL